MQIKKSVFVSSLVVSGLVFGAIGVGASNGIQKIQAALNSNIKFVLNGSSWTPKDNNGQKLSALVYNGTTYLPLRSTAEALGVELGWNNATQTITLTSGDGGNDGIPYNDALGSSSAPSGSTSTPAPAASSSSSSGAATSAGVIKYSGTTEQMTAAMKEQAVLLVKAYGDALKTGKMDKYNEYLDKYTSEKDNTSTGRTYYKDKFKKLVNSTVSANKPDVINEYANVLLNVKASDIEKSWVSDKDEYGQAFDYSYYPDGWNALGSGVHIYFNFAPLQKGSSNLVLVEAYIS
ncbi:MULTISPECIES: stalk domain-containing protein [unclassified Paenibacillus]|uniref:stalk domain-containing protein n=1 Tax=unclassified Paenibacillus TaxID=185978 RepID=UPI0036BB0290